MVLVRFLRIPARARHQHGNATYRSRSVAFLVSAHNARGAQGAIAHAKSPLPLAPSPNSDRTIVCREDML